SYAKFLLIHPRPKTETEAKFSLEYCVARALLDGEIGIGQFTPEKIKDVRVRSLIPKVHPDYYEAENEGGREPLYPVEVRVIMKSGCVYSVRAEYAKGTRQIPFTDAEREAKLRQCCLGILAEDRTAQLAEQLRRFEAIPDIAAFVGIVA
ncbi:MAG: hypothetical protein EG826_15870, partial [Deltaproteobacteria bacterium]|nr:hypothetical protein [Deltaproteobacteria bacterium]